MDRLQEVLEAYVEDCNLEGGDIVSGVRMWPLAQHGACPVCSHELMRRPAYSGPVPAICASCCLL